MSGTRGKKRRALKGSKTLKACDAKRYVRAIKG
jgi:hypothetical protein